MSRRATPTRRTSPDGGAGRLTPKQQLFVESYIGVANGNGTEAARLAGYKGTSDSLKVTASRLLTNANVASLVDRRLATAKRCMSADEVLEHLTDVAEAPWRDFCDVQLGEDGETLSVRMRLTDKLKALELLGKRHKLFIDRVEHSGEVAAKVYEGINAGKV